MERGLCNGIIIFSILILKFYYRLDSDDPMQFAWTVLITVVCTTAVWVCITFLTRPEREELLVSFYRRVRPGKTFWGPIALKAPDVPQKADIAFNILDWFCGCLLVYMTLFGTGKLIFGQRLMGLAFFSLRLCRFNHILDLNRRGWKSVME
jgi:SSS family solute:Na+ symporter